MPFFNLASDFTVRDNHMYEVSGDVNIHFAMAPESTERIATQLIGKGKERDLDKGDAETDEKFREVRDETLDGLTIVDPKDIDLHRQLTSRSNYRTHSAFYGGRVVAVKVFHGPRAKQSWKLNLTLAKNFFHSNVTKIVGISGESESESPFIVFHGIFDRKMNSLLAKVLRTDLNKSVQLSMKTVKGLAAGLSYMELKGIVSNLKWENFDIFAGGSEEPILSINLPDTTAHGPQSAPSFDHPEDHCSWMEILNGLCQKLFSEVNSILYDDSPERELDTNDLVEMYSGVVQTNRGGHSNVAEDVSSSTKVRTSHKTPRREVRWKLEKCARHRSLESIVRRFEDYLDCVLESSAGSPLRRITASPHNLASHRCPGYLREEITLTADVSRSVVVAHQYPSQSEICTICGQLVQYPSDSVPRLTTKRRRQSLPKINIPPPSIGSIRGYVSRLGTGGPKFHPFHPRPVAIAEDDDEQERVPQEWSYRTTFDPTMVSKYFQKDTVPPNLKDIQAVEHEVERVEEEFVSVNIPKPSIRSIRNYLPWFRTGGQKFHPVHPRPVTIAEDVD